MVNIEKPSIDLSVIVACYNVYPYIIDCLSSIVQTNFPKNRLEVIVIDDGSTDETRTIINHFDFKYPFVHVYREPNQGASVARNYGMTKARGKYIAFADGDDIVPKNAYTNLMYCAERNHSNIVAGFARRFNNLKNVGSYLHKFAIIRNEDHTTIEQSPNLLYDTTIWNKVYLRSFLVKHNLQFNPDLLYEDLPFVLKAHLLSNNDATIKNNVYNWRWRDNSITGSRSNFSNFTARLTSLNVCKKELFKAGYTDSSTLYKDFIFKVLNVDLNIFLENIGDNSEDYIYKVQELTYKFLRDWKINGHSLLHSQLLRQLPIKTQALYYAVKTGNLDLLKHFTYHGKRSLGHFSSHQFSKQYNYHVPLLPNYVQKHINVNNNVLPVQQFLSEIKVKPINKSLNHIITGKGMFRIKGMRMLKHPIVNSNYHEDLQAFLINLSNNKRLSIDIKRQKTPLYKRLLHSKTKWTNSRYVFAFNELEAKHILGKGIWRIKVNDIVKANNNSRTEYKVTKWLGQPGTRKRSIIHTNILDTGFTPAWTLEFQPHQTQNQCSIEESSYYNHHLAFLVSSYPNNTIPVIQFNNDIYLKGNVERIDGEVHAINFDLRHWTQPINPHYYKLRLLNINTNHYVDYHAKKLPIRYLSIHKSNIVVVSYVTQFNNIKVSLQHQPVRLTTFKLIDDNSNFQFTFTAPNTFSKDDIALSNKYGYFVLLSTNKKHRYQQKIKDVDWDKQNILNIKIPIFNWEKRQLEILSGKYYGYLYLYYDNEMQKISIAIPDKLISQKYNTLIQEAGNYVQFALQQGTHLQLMLRVRQHLTGWNSKKSHRALNYSVLYPLMRLLPLKKNLVAFDSYWGHQFSSNERAIYNYLQNQKPGMECAWILKNNQIKITGNGKRIRNNTLKYWYLLARAKYIFQNTNMRNRYFKRPGQIETETLHGTFLKHMGFDEPHFKNAKQGRQNKFARRISRWDHMVVPSNYMAKVASNAFNYHKDILKTGFPRNDALIKNNKPSYINKIKKHLHIPLDKKIILYAPTYRKYDKDFHLDLKHLRKALGNNVMILVRLHYFVSNTHTFYQYPHFVRDVSDYPNINDLYLISNVLITDYSSVMFDYAYLNRPMIFYAYDEGLYLDNRIRGTYLDYQKDMPGPIVNNQNDLEFQLEHLKQVENKYKNKMKWFRKVFTQYGRKGNATKRVVNNVLNKSLNYPQNTDNHVIFNKFWHLFRINNLQSRLLNKLGRILPKKNIIIFDSFFGTQYSDNPKYLYLYIKRHYPQFDLYWNVNQEDVSYFKKHNIPYVVRFSYSGVLIQAQAKYWITNTRRPFRWHVPKGARMLMTWHGTPLKTLGADVKHMTMPGNNAKKYHKQVYKDNRRWDKLVVPNMYSARIMHNAFRMNYNQLIVTGYPRNDILVRHAKDKKFINNIKYNLHLPTHKKIVLYAPTWRDNEYIKSNEFIAHIHLDLSKMKKHYGNRLIVLVRTHYMISNQLDLSKYKGFAYDVSNYPDISKLYLISDALITDYSSVMFDYALLKRPIIFFDYDLDNYTHNTRGFYFNFKKIAPGPIVKTTDKVIYYLDKLLKPSWKPSKKYRNFSERFGQFEDGENSSRVAQQFLGNNNVFIKHIKKHPKFIGIVDGALLWHKNLDLTAKKALNNGTNYDIKQNNQYAYKIKDCIQLCSTYWQEPLGHKFYEINVNGEDKWIIDNDALKPNKKEGK